MEPQKLIRTEPAREGQPADPTIALLEQAIRGASRIPPCEACRLDGRDPAPTVEQELGGRVIRVRVICEHRAAELAEGEQAWRSSLA